MLFLPFHLNDVDFDVEYACSSIDALLDVVDALAYAAANDA